MTAHHRRKNQRDQIKLPGLDHRIRRPLHHHACAICYRVARPHDRRELARSIEQQPAKTRDRRVLARD